MTLDAARSTAITRSRPRTHPRARFCLYLMATAASSGNVIAASTPDWSGSISAQVRAFAHDAVDARQDDLYTSLATEPEWFWEWDDGKQRLIIAPFARWDDGDDARSHADLRKFYWSVVATQWEFRFGINKVFWGVTESQHLVDVINQTDWVEDVDGEDKFGQPMANLAVIGPHGTFDIFVLPYFRQRSFPGAAGRPRSEPYVDTDQSQFESDDGEHHVDGAIRWAQSADIFDIGLSYFTGTSRDPTFLLGSRENELVLVPFYPVIRQFGIDAQATTGPWLLKFEGIHRSGQNNKFNAITTGIEYTFNGVLGSAADLGWVVEYLYDNRGESSPTSFEDDVMIGMRATLNDAQSTESLLGAIIDASGDARVWTLEASRRLGANWKISAGARYYQNVTPDSILYGLRHDDSMQLTAAFFF